MSGNTIGTWIVEEYVRWKVETHANDIPRDALDDLWDEDQAIQEAYDEAEREREANMVKLDDIVSDNDLTAHGSFGATHPKARLWYTAITDRFQSQINVTKYP